MEGSVTKRKDGRWQGVVEIPSLTEKRKRKYVYAKTRMECRRKVNELIEQVERSGIMDITKLTFSQYAQKYLDTYCANLSPTTIVSYKKSIKTYASKYIGDMVISKILPMHIQEMINDFSKTHANKTCHCLLSDIRGVFKYAILNKSLIFNPCEGINIPKDYKSPDYYIYTEKEYRKLLDLVTGAKEEIPPLLAGLCGLRISEIMGLAWNDINFETCVIDINKAAVHTGSKVIIKTTKSRTSYRKVVAPVYVIERLKLYKSVGYIYPKKNGTPEHGGNYGKRFARMIKNAGLPHTRFHDLRHFNATMMLKRGVSDKQAAARLGHSDTNMTKKYQHILSDMENRPAEILNSIISMDVKKDVK